jgi:hypothetical protein
MYEEAYFSLNWEWVGERDVKVVIKFRKAKEK